MQHSNTLQIIKQNSKYTQTFFLTLHKPVNTILQDFDVFCFTLVLQIFIITEIKFPMDICKLEIVLRPIH